MIEQLIYLWKTALPMIAGCLFAYLVGAFVGVSFNPANWTGALREFMAIAGVVWGCALWANFWFRGFYDSH
jgi:hypothetical protein